MKDIIKELTQNERNYLLFHILYIYLPTGQKKTIRWNNNTTVDSLLTQIENINKYKCVLFMDNIEYPFPPNVYIKDIIKSPETIFRLLEYNNIDKFPLLTNPLENFEYNILQMNSNIFSVIFNADCWDNYNKTYNNYIFMWTRYPIKDNYHWTAVNKYIIDENPIKYIHSEDIKKFNVIKYNIIVELNSHISISHINKQIHYHKLNLVQYYNSLDNVLYYNIRF